MRTIDDHKVNPANDRIDIIVTDDPGPGGANHEYDIKVDNIQTGFTVHLSFQNGPINEAGVNGITQEVLLAIVADRLRSFQAGKFACRENAIALTKIEEAKPSGQVWSIHHPDSSDIGVSQGTSDGNGWFTTSGKG